MTRTLLIAHRGDTQHYPENTLPAFRSAFALGADGVELDIHAFDGQLVVVHNFLFDESRSYPVLPQVLEQESGAGRLEIEVKSFDLEFLPLLQATLAAYPTADIELTTSNFVLLAPLKQAFPQLPVGVIFPSDFFSTWMTPTFTTEAIVNTMIISHMQVAHVPIEHLTAELVSACHARSIKFHTHISKQSLGTELQVYRQLCELDVDQCSFDDVNLLEAVRQ